MTVYACLPDVLNYVVLIQSIGNQTLIPGLLSKKEINIWLINT